MRVVGRGYRDRVRNLEVMLESLVGRQRQHSAVICSGALLFSSRVLRPSLVTLCSHKSGRCAVLNSTMRLISGALRSTPLPWLPVLSNIELPALRSKAATMPSWWRKSSNMTVGQSSLISLAHHCYEPTTDIQKAVVARFATS